MSKIREHLSYANAMATVAVFIALGGASYAAVAVPKNSVGSVQIKKNAVTGAKIKKGAVTGAKIKLSTLGTVPSAANAQTLGGLTTTQISDASKLRCPSDMALAAGTCIETTARAAAPLPTALQICAEANRALPSMGQLMAYEAQNYATSPPAEWIGQMYFDGSSFRGLVAATQKGGVVSTSPPPFNEAEPYRCSQGPSN